MCCFPAEMLLDYVVYVVVINILLFCPPMQRAAFFWAKTKRLPELTLIDNQIDNNCL